MAYFKLKGAESGASGLSPGPFPRGAEGAAGAGHFLPPWEGGHLSWGRTQGWEVGLFQGSLEDVFMIAQ